MVSFIHLWTNWLTQISNKAVTDTSLEQLKESLQVMEKLMSSLKTQTEVVIGEAEENSLFLLLYTGQWQ